MVERLTPSPPLVTAMDPAPAAAPQYDGRASILFRLYAVNLLRELATLGAYRFWSKTRLRRYLWSHARYDGDRLEYAGTATELLKGFAIVAGALLPLVAIVALANAFSRAIHPGLVFLLNLATYAFLGYLLFVGRYAALRYRLGRSQFRGIRGGLSGSAWRYGWLGFRSVFLRGFTFGLATPIEDMRLWSYRIRHARFGTAHTEFPEDTTAHGLFLPYSLYWLTLVGGTAVVYYMLEGLIADRAAIFAPYVLPEDPSAPVDLEGMLLDPVTRAALLEVAAICAPVALAVAIAVPFVRGVYLGGLIRRLVGLTRIAGLRFEVSFSDIELGRHLAGNLLILGFTLGLGLPLVRHRQWQFFVSHLQVFGRMDGRTIAQSRVAAPGFGEGLAGVLDAGGAF